VPIGFIDDDTGKTGRSIHGVRVLGGRADLARVFAEHEPEEVLLAIPTALPQQVRSIVRALEAFKVPIKTLPNMRDILEGRVAVSQIRTLSLEDLMSRPPVGLDAESVRHLINGRRVLVTGAGGSIGSELCRQIAALGPAKLLLLERHENSLFELCAELDARTPSSAYEPLVADIADERRIGAIFAEHQPELVFHAAAHKHVPLMEQHPCEAVKNNVRGTRIVAEAAARYGASEFVLISSDKAVNPSSVMGATKRVAEQIVRALAARSSTRFVAVRFGNVLGSNGSVARTFAAQIARGGPVTVTHPEIRRFFMLIPEAVQLVLHAATVKESGAILVLEMGEPVRIVDLARNLIRLSGFVPDEDIEIQYTGLRPGEKLYEELVEPSEEIGSSGIPQVLRVASSGLPPELAMLVGRLEDAAADGLDRDALAVLGLLVPTFGMPRTSSSRMGEQQ
jgi:FlaA1/EpsC-like NDP-sugar epimerase